ncbi:MAG TPA: dTDP-4-dehydrorhamnose reductase [Acidimicrobiales bacterium]|nr:dTDP-4-dehydrorhamnose reductase [Acidimicrobiales bacterium]
MRALITGAGGQVGRELEAALAASPHHEVLALSHGDLDISDRERALQVLGEWSPEVVINAAAFTAVDACEEQRDKAFAINAIGARNLAEGARLAGAHLVHLSTDYVFDGESPRPYTEWDEPHPICAYGESKLAGEREVLSLLPGAAVVRTSWVCGRYGANMLKTILRLAGTPGQLRFVDDQRGCPTFADDLAAMLVRLGVERIPGTFHVTNQGVTTWYGFAREVLSAAGEDPARVLPIRTEDLVPARPARRPKNSVLDNAALRLLGLALLPGYQAALERTVAHLVAQARSAATT